VRRSRWPDTAVTLRRLRHIGIGKRYTATYVIPLVQDLNVRVIRATTGELLHELSIDPRRDYQLTGRARCYR